MSDWSLELDGVRKTFGQWGLKGGSVRFINLAVDQFSIVRDGANFDAAPLCAYRATARLYNTAARKIFEGRRQLVPGEASGNHERQGYVFAGPWQWLEQNLFKQTWVGGIGGVLTQLFTSHLILSGSGTQIITAVLNHAIARGAPLQIGVINIPVSPPISEIVDRTCAAVILDVLQYAPDAVGSFDYSTSPPTFHCRRRPELAAVTLAIPPAASQSQVNVSLIDPIQARPDLQVPSVELTYEIINQVDGQSKFGWARDAYPPGATGLEDGCLSSVVNLQGFSATHVRGTLRAEAVNTASLAWWNKFFPWLQGDNRVFNVSIATPATRIGTDGLASLGLQRYLVQDSGAAAEWMVNPDGSSLVWDEDLFTIEVNFDLYIDATRAADVQVQRVKRRRLTVPLMTVNAPVGETNYQTLETLEAGDPVPVGLARFLYDSLSPLHYDASIQLTEAECSGVVGLGNVINLAGSDPGYLTMRALVQQVALDIDNGVTNITSGPPRQLSLRDVLELLKANRARRRWTNPATQTTGNLSGPSNVEMGRATPGANSVPGQGVSTFFAVKDGTGKVAMDGALMDLSLTGSTAQRIRLRNLDGIRIGDPTDTGPSINLLVNAEEKKFLINFGNNQKVTIDAAAAAWLAAINKELKIIEYGVCVKINNVDTPRKATFIATDHYA